MEIAVDMQSVLMSNYLPYAKTTIISRAICGIDGLKPVQRRVLFTMMQMGLLNGDKVKSHTINGKVMAIHPNGDSSIYDSLALMSRGYNAFNTPYIDSKGNFGAKYSRDLKRAAPRYTEAKLMPICREMFDGLKENAVDIVDNYDGKSKEPSLLPVKFPTILVNTSSGVAVGTSSNIPSFSLVNVCKATQAMLDGKINDAGDLAQILGAPEFTTGGFLHASEKSLKKLCETGKGSFIISGKVEVYQNRIIVNEIPYSTTAEDIVEAIEDAVKEKKLRGIRDVNDMIGKDGFKLIIEIKSGYNSREILADLCRLTPLRTSISFTTRVVINNRCCEIGLYDLLKEWISFRENCIIRQYSYRLDKYKADEHLNEAWEKIINNVPRAVEIISHNTEAEACKLLKIEFNLDDEQIEFLMEMKIRMITVDNALKKIDELNNKIRVNIAEAESIINTQSIRYKMIWDDQENIIKTYGSSVKTMLARELTDDDLKKPEVKISDELATVVYTRNGFVRRLSQTKDIYGTFVSKDGDEEVLRWTIKNNQHLLVFDKFGTVHKILVDTIDASNKGQLTDRLCRLAGLEKPEDILYADACGDYSGYFNVIDMVEGKGFRVTYDKAIGNRAQYKSLYKEVNPKRQIITKENNFFAITNKRKASYVDIRELGLISSRMVFKIGRLGSGEFITRIIPVSKVPNMATIDISKYSKEYPVLIRNDVLWVDEDAVKRGGEAKKHLLEEFNRQITANAEGDEETEGSMENDLEENEKATPEVLSAEDAELKKVLDLYMFNS